MTEKIKDNLHRIIVTLPGSPLRTLNCYVMTSPERNLIIDTGFNIPGCLESLRGGLDELGIDMGQTDIFLTHFHSDHVGLVPEIVKPGTRVYLSGVDEALLRGTLEDTDAYWAEFESYFIADGYPAEEMAKTHLVNPARLYRPARSFESIAVQDGDELLLAGRRLRCVATPGHTPGHTCLYDPEQKILFTGDHVLYDITPNITQWPSLPNSLKCYLDSLAKVDALEVKLALAAHRDNSGTLHQRVTQLREHHRHRIADTLRIVKAHPGINGYETASKMEWKISADSWEDFPPGQRFFAVGEAISHLEYLRMAGEITLAKVNGINTYHAVQA